MQRLLLLRLQRLLLLQLPLLLLLLLLRIRPFIALCAAAQGLFAVARPHCCEVYRQQLCCCSVVSAAAAAAAAVPKGSKAKDVEASVQRRAEGR